VSGSYDPDVKSFSQVAVFFGGPGSLSSALADSDFPDWALFGSAFPALATAR
jgi:hypothetical protein